MRLLLTLSLLHNLVVFFVHCFEATDILHAFFLFTPLLDNLGLKRVEEGLKSLHQDILLDLMDRYSEISLPNIGVGSLTDDEDQKQNQEYDEGSAWCELIEKLAPVMIRRWVVVFSPVRYYFVSEDLLV